MWGVSDNLWVRSSKELCSHSGQWELPGAPGALTTPVTSAPTPRARCVKNTLQCDTDL